MKDQKSKEMIEKIERTDKLCPQCNGAGNDIYHGGSCRTCNGRGIISIKFYELIKEKIAKKFGVKDLYHEFFINGCSLDEVLDDTITATNTSFRELVQGIKIDFRAMQKCMEFTGWKYPCKNMDCKRRVYCPLAFNGDLNNRLNILASLDGDEIKQNG